MDDFTFRRIIQRRDDEDDGDDDELRSIFLCWVVYLFFSLHFRMLSFGFCTRYIDDGGGGGDTTEVGPFKVAL